jgi:hypothetical protein
MGCAAERSEAGIGLVVVVGDLVRANSCSLAGQIEESIDLVAGPTYEGPKGVLHTVPAVASVVEVRMGGRID